MSEPVDVPRRVPMTRRRLAEEDSAPLRAEDRPREEPGRWRERR